MTTVPAWFVGSAVALGLWVMVVTAITVLSWGTRKLAIYWLESMKLCLEFFDYLRNRKRFVRWKAEQAKGKKHEAA